MVKHLACESGVGPYPLARLKKLALVGVGLLSFAASEISPRGRASFEDITILALGHNLSFQQQLSRGIDYWAAHLDAASRMDFFGLNGIAVGDYDGDDLDDFYVCQPGGLPNRLFRNQGNATFRDVTSEAGLDVLDSTSAALWADYDNDGRQDLFVLTNAGVLLFENVGQGRFQLSQTAQFKISPQHQGVLTGGALADYDRDGLLDLYICQYSRAGGATMANSLHQPTPYHDAQNGAPNQLFRNNGDGSFTNVTEQAGLSANNNRWSFAAAWGDYNDDRFPDLYVANDFGRNNLYVNKGDGTFQDLAQAAGVEDQAAGMSAAWGDYDNDGRPDLYVGNIWSAAGQAIMGQSQFQPQANEAVRKIFQRFAAGNTLFRNRGNGTFEEVSRSTGASRGGWAWSSDFIDVDNDGWEDLYVVNGHITNDVNKDLERFHWEELVARSPLDAQRSATYEDTWRKFQRLMLEEGYSIHGGERNRLFLNDAGRYLEVSKGSGLDWPDDGRAFAASDFDNDGDLDIFLKSRTAPQVRILRNRLSTLNKSVAFELRGRKSNRDAIGTKIRLRSGGSWRYKEVKAGSGFLSQHSRRVFFGLSERSSLVEVRIEWTSGTTESFSNLPVDSVIRIEEGSGTFMSRPFGKAQEKSISRRNDELASERPREDSGSWLLEPIGLRDLLTLVSSQSDPMNLTVFKGAPLAIRFRAADCPTCLPEKPARLGKTGTLLTVQLLDDENFHAGADTSSANAWFISRERFQLVATIIKHLFVRRRTPSLPLTLLLDSEGRLIKIYRSDPSRERLLQDLQLIPASQKDRLRLALPFPGKRYGALGGRLEAYFLIASELLGQGHNEAAVEFYHRALEIDPTISEIHNNMAAAYAQLGRLKDSLHYFREAARLDPKNSEVLFNLGTSLAMDGQLQDAVSILRQAATMNPSAPRIWHNLGNAYLDLGRSSDARVVFERSLQLDSSRAEVHNSLGTLYAEEGQWNQAMQSFREAARLQPDFLSAYLNLGILYWKRERHQEALEMFRKVLEISPDHPDARRWVEELTE